MFFRGPDFPSRAIRAGDMFCLSMKRRNAIASALVLLVTVGCGATNPPRGGSRVEPASSSGDYDFRREGKIPPPANGQAATEADVEELVVSDSSLDVTEADAPVDTVPAIVAPADSMAGGFRIQVFASADRDVAQSARDAAAQRLGVPAYLDLEAGVYKVRVGDYASRQAADQALPTVRSHYYPDAWIVPAQVRVPRPR